MKKSIREPSDLSYFENDNTSKCSLVNNYETENKKENSNLLLNELNINNKKIEESVSEKKEMKITENYISIPIKQIQIKENIREIYNEEGLKELSESMKQYGQLQPVRVFEEDNYYNIIFGHRRYYSAKLAGFSNLNCIICKKPDTLENILLQITENEQKENVNISDLEKYVNILIKEHKLSVNEIAQKINKSNAYVYQLKTAFENRSRIEDKFNKKGIYGLSNRDIVKLKNCSEDEIFEAVALCVENPRHKTEIIENAKKQKKIKSNKINNYIPKEYSKVIKDNAYEYLNKYIIDNNTNDETKNEIMKFLNNLFTYFEEH